MNIKKNILIVAIPAVLFACGVNRNAPRAGRLAQETENMIPAPENFPQGTAVSFLYTEGVRNSIAAGQEAAKELFMKVLDIDSMHAPTYYELGNGYRNSPDSALMFIRRAVRLDSTNVWYISALGHAFVANKMYDSALTVYNTLIGMAPENPMNYQVLAALYREQKQPFSAISVLDSAELKLGANEMFSSFKRQVMMEAGLYDRALAEAEEIAANFPYDGENYRALGELYSQAGRDSLAVASFEKGLDVDPDNIETLISLNDFYKQHGDNLNFIATAKKIFLSDGLPADVKAGFFREITASDAFYRDYYFQINDLVLTLAIKYPKNIDVIRLYARHLMLSGNIEGTLGLYKANIHDPAINKEMLHAVLDYEAYLKRPDSLAKYADIALGYYPDDAGFYMSKGSLLSYYFKDYKGAVKEFGRALEYAGSDSLRSVIYGSMADNSHAQNRQKESYRYYEKAIKCDSTNVMALNNYSYFLSESGKNLELALSMSEKVTRLAPTNPTYIDTHAWVLYKLGRYAEAKALMRQAVALDSRDNKELFFHYGEILHALGEDFMAGVYWKKALESGYDEELVRERLKLIGE